MYLIGEEEIKEGIISNSIKTLYLHPEVDYVYSKITIIDDAVFLKNYGGAVGLRYFSM